VATRIPPSKKKMWPKISGRRGGKERKKPRKQVEKRAGTSSKPRTIPYYSIRTKRERCRKKKSKESRGRNGPSIRLRPKKK